MEMPRLRTCCETARGAARGGCSQESASSAAFHSEVTCRSSGESCLSLGTAGCSALQAGADSSRAECLRSCSRYWSRVLEKPCVLLHLDLQTPCALPEPGDAYSKQSCRSLHREWTGNGKRSPFLLQCSSFASTDKT